MAEKAEVFYDESLTTPQAICDWITHLGFSSTLMRVSDSESQKDHSDGQVELHISGMTCASCVYNIESHLEKLDGVLEARVALSTQRGVVTFDSDRVGPRQIIEHITVFELS